MSNEYRIVDGQRILAAHQRACDAVVEDLQRDALEILRAAGVIPMVCSHGFDIDLCLYERH